MADSDLKEARRGYIKFRLQEAAAHGKAFCWGLCCVQGCIWGVIGGIYFFVFLPSGFLLILYGSNKSLAWAVVTGSVLLALSTCVLPGLCLCVRWYRRRQRDRRREYREQRNKQVAEETYVNPVEDMNNVQIADTEGEGTVDTVLA